jgi:hypothetical protein
MAGSPETRPPPATPSPLRIASLACCVLGAWLRIDYALFHHHLRHRATSDALLYLERAQDLLQRGAVPELPATIWPPGTAALWATLSAIDPSQQLTAAVNTGASILVMPLTAAIAGLLAGRRAAWIALAIAALHPGFIHYAGFALAEQPFQLAIAIAIYLTLSALVRLESDPLPRVVAPPPTAARAMPATQTGSSSSSDAGRTIAQPTGAAIASASEAEPSPADPAQASHYIQAEVVMDKDSKPGRRGTLGAASPGGGSAQGKWFGRFNRKSDPAPAPEPDFSAARRGFIGRTGADTPATSARRSAFADRGSREAFGRPNEGRASESLRTDPARATGDSAARGLLPFKSGAGRESASATPTSRKRELEPAGEVAAARSAFSSGPPSDHGDLSPSASEPGERDVARHSSHSRDDTAEATAAADGRPERNADGDLAAEGGEASGPAASFAAARVDGGGSDSAAMTDGAPRAGGEAADADVSARHATQPSGTRQSAADTDTAEPVPQAAGTEAAARRLTADALAGTGRLWTAGAAIGCAWALAALVRPNALPVAACGALALLVFSRNRLPSRTVWAALAASAAILIALGGAAHRCTATADGRFCLVSNNLAMNVALGQAGPVYGIEFHDPRYPERTTRWIAPSLVQHGYQGMLQIPASVYDSGRIWSWVADRFAQDPLGYLVRAAGNAFDLFNLGYWPDEFGRYSERSALVLRQAWSAAVFIPGLFALFGLARRAFSPTPTRPVALFVLGAGFGVLLSAALSIGESRYRIPFDGLLIGLASACYARVPDWPVVGFISAEPLGARRWALWLQALAVTGLAIIALTHPGINLGLLLPQRETALPNRGRHDWATAADFVIPHAAGSAWNGPGTYVWQCNPDCGELQVRLGGRRHARRVHVSVDHNDRYRLLFYRSGQLQAYADVAPALDTPAGLQSTELEVPRAARAGFDVIGVQPLYGDGGYSIGHLILE